ncbi:helix-turn-helix domain-containing protein [Gordonia sp. 852002-50395_SCH5434458]|uniref:helix-turn-helix domain-containing protein n=1 Tax=Gordonia sp. 852002-50395_SCH5434458 TaxID=1834090 RepID=UPI0007E97E7F|nr:helix-turn-helix domain-containing protein [Gordonia sp. 852002-50395_SCH5434458]OBC02687.1 hypothetical protein A5785_02425 [Gordonia sp. 852002-50395_SCH5434458]
MGLIPEDAVRGEDVRAELGIGRQTWRALLRDGVIPSAKLGKTIYVKRTDVQRYVESQFAASA